MILKALTLENFKGIREPVRIEFAPLTLLFGPNNAGKSTVVQALMYAREVLERRHCDVGQTVLGGDVVDLGGFDNLVHGHDRNRAIRMRFDLHLPQGARSEKTDWVRDAKLESSVGFFYPYAIKELAITSAASLGSQLVDVWVELEIAWNDVHEKPLVRTYAVGVGSDEYARISFDTDKGEASLSHFNFGIHPFGTRYEKGDLTDFEWELAKEARKYVRRAMEKHDLDNLKLKKGARVAMVGEEVPESANRLPREKFDDIIKKIVLGEGDWGDSTIDDDTGEHNEKYARRQSLIELAKARTEPVSLTGFDLDPGIFDDIITGLSDLEKDAPGALDGEAKSDHPSKFGHDESKAEADNSVSEQVSNDANDYVCEEFESRMEHLVDGNTYEIDSWMLELFAALLYEDNIPIRPNWALPLPLKGSALPEWGRIFELDYSVWMPYESNEFWDSPAFASEFLKDLLTVVIVNPGEQLLSALKDALYISPFRTMPPRHYQPSRSPDPSRWANGLAAWDWLLLEEKSFAGQVNNWLTGKDKFNAGYAIDVRHYRELEVDDPVLAALTAEQPRGDLDLDWVREQLLKLPEGRSLKIKDLRSGVSLFPQDLGVGISQVIPVIVATLRNQAGVVAIEEPESNIHPAFQLVLADLFMTQTKVNPQALFLVETHSEHLMLRCLRRIREAAQSTNTNNGPYSSPEDVAVHFVQSTENGPRIHRIKIDDEGDFIEDWPDGFFEERDEELF